MSGLDMFMWKLLHIEEAEDDMSEFLSGALPKLIFDKAREVRPSDFAFLLKFAPLVQVRLILHFSIIQIHQTEPTPLAPLSRLFLQSFPLRGIVLADA
jgi:hypothetical protein